MAGAVAPSPCRHHRPGSRPHRSIRPTEETPPRDQLDLHAQVTPQAAADRDGGREAVRALVQAFGDELAYHKSTEFDETTNRQRFIDPFFAALGWDVADESHRGPYADVLLEYSLREADMAQAANDEDEEDERVETALAEKNVVGSIGVRRPDYSFRINGERRFFVEAKRPSVDIKSPRPIYQVKSYGWSARTPLALLTDFEELLVFDCRYRPVLDEPLTGLLTEFRLTFNDYVEHWDALWVFKRIIEGLHTPCRSWRSSDVNCNRAGAGQNCSPGSRG